MRGSRQRLDRLLQRQPDVHRRARAAVGKRARVVGRRQNLKHSEVGARSHDADHGELLVIQTNRAAKDRRIAPERARPEALADHHDRRTAGACLLRRERSPRERTHAEHGQELVGHDQSLKSDRLAGVWRVVHLVAGKRGDLFHALAALLVVEKVGQRRRLARRAGVAIGLPHHGERVDVLHRRRPQQHGIDDAEDRGIGADTERHGQQGDDGEGGIADEQPEGIPKILAKHGRTPD